MAVASAAILIVLRVTFTLTLAFFCIWAAYASRAGLLGFINIQDRESNYESKNDD